MSRLAPLAVAAALIVPAAALAQRPTVTLTPHVGVINTGAFYKGPITTGAPNGVFSGPVLFTEGQLRLESATAWGARLTVRPHGARWALELDGTTSATTVSSSGSQQYASFWFRGIDVRISTFALGAARELRPVRGARLTGRIAGSLASTTFPLRRFVVGGPSSGYVVYVHPTGTASWARRYVSPGGEAGLGFELPFRRAFAVTAAAAVGLVRNETGDFATDRRSVITPVVDRRESYLMPYSRVTLGVGMTR